MKKKILLLISTMKGGGAERVAALLLNEFHKKGYECEYMLTSCKTSDAVKRDLSEEIPLTSLQDDIEPKSLKEKLGEKLSSLICKPFEALGLDPPEKAVDLSFVSQYGREIRALRDKLSKEPDTVCIGFLQPAMPILLLAAKDLPNRVIISERADPNRLMRHRYGEKFIPRHYVRADGAVFQTEDAMRIYPSVIAEKGRVISNPVKDDLPEPFDGKRNDHITTFCRVSRQKNLPLLLSAFEKLRAVHPEYILRIIGDAVNSEGEEVMKELKNKIASDGMGNSVLFEPFSPNVHEKILKDAMYVNSSDYEGISNAMLEAMSIGLPCVCTDCPIGGAKQTVTDGVNGLLVPVGDSEALFKAMLKIAENEELAKKLSENGRKIRDSLSLEKTAEKWLELLEDQPFSNM